MINRVTELDLWEMLRTIYDAEQYLLHDAGERDIAWTSELQEATLMLQKAASVIRKRIAKEEKQ